MTDKELLERAAKAAGYTLGTDWDCLPVGVFINGDDRFSGIEWNPLADDGDAFRLAVDLSLFDGIDERASALAAEVAFDMCPRAATRRAIVRAAAQLA